MAFKNQFEKEINVLTKKRTHWLTTTLFSNKVGRPPKLDKATLEKSISVLQDLATKALAKKIAKSEFKKCVQKEKKWKVTGRGEEQQKKNFLTWFDRNFGGDKNYVYVFWGKNNKCLYVGRSNGRNARPKDHFEKRWAISAKRINIITTSHYKDLAKLECLAQHHYDPTNNKIKVATKKWNASCPLCSIHKSIQKELTDIYWNCD